MDKDRADWLEGAYTDLLGKYDALRAVNAELLAAAEDLVYYFQCMTDDDLRLISDMMGDPPPVDALVTAVAKATAARQRGGEEQE